VRSSGRRLAFSPSDLSDFLACEHLTTLELRVARGGLPRREAAEDAQADLIRRKGDEHEARYLSRLRAGGRDVAEIAFDGDWDAAAAATEQAIHARREVVYQACLVDGDWRGFSDFVELQPDGGYEIVDTKLGRSPKPAHVFQLCFYSSVVGRIQDRPPAHAHLELGDGRRESFRLADFDAYYRRIRERFTAAVAAGAETYPYPVEHCAICAWRATCEQRWADDDHLVQVAGIRRKQVERLLAAGVETLEQLGDAAPDTRVARLAPHTFETLRHQAELQLARRRTGEHRVDHLPLARKRGFALLPPPSPGDVYYDIEGDPFFDAEGGLEYLHGLVHDDGEFTGFRARDRAEEKVAFEQLVDTLIERRRRDPGMHVYHYANYERAALQRLMQAHGTREDEVDELLRGHVLVDLFQVVRQALRLSLPSYSLKKVEKLYFPPRETDVLGGDESTVVFERWLESGDDALLDAIEAYNRDDCLSTWKLHAWLVAQRPDLPWAEPPVEREPGEKGAARRSAAVEAQTALRAAGRTLLADLLDFHRRDAKPAWWEYFRRLTLDEQQLIEDGDAIAGIEPDAAVEPYPHKRSLVWELTFPPQEFKIGSDAVDPATEKSPGEILEIDESRGRIRLKRGKSKQERPLPLALVPAKPLTETVQQEALLRLACAGDGELRAARAILDRAPPRADLRDPLTAALTLDESYVFVQGPPGSGKTWQGAELAVELMRRGRKVGVAAQSHKAIHKFLDDAVARAGERGFAFRGVKKASGHAGTRYEGSGPIDNETENESAAAADVDLLAGTSWFFSRADVVVDTLFLDEAGQISLADALAMATCARNVVLLGDPNQLPQVTQGAQPAEVRASVLEHLLGGDSTVPPGRGIFLERTWRLRPEICRFVSDAFYEGRLEPAGVCARRETRDGVGLRFAPVEHVGNRQRSREEAAWIAAEIRRLLGTGFRDADGAERPLVPSDFLVVAPYNMQVRCLREALPAGVPVGTVDRFQGQQAPVVFFSMATSSGADLPRGIEFLFSPNRFNVAISRAQCLVYVVASPRLLVADARTPEQMRLINTVCRFAEAADVR
jgi:predicted RecB family nuclease